MAVTPSPRENSCAADPVLVVQVRGWSPRDRPRRSNCLRRYMTHLRHTLEDDLAYPLHLLTEFGMGYRFTP